MCIAMVVFAACRPVFFWRESMSMIVNRRDLDFMLYETLAMHESLKSPRYSDSDKTAIDAVFDLVPARGTPKNRRSLMALRC